MTALKAAERAEAARILQRFLDAGAVEIEADVLLPASSLLDLYGEDIRARAYVTRDPVEGEMMLRPDFTLPVVERHMAGGAEPARYAYAGEVFRRQDRPGGRPREYLQAGFEVFARGDPAAADAEVFAIFAAVLAPLDVEPATGDVGLLAAAVDGLRTTPRRKAALRRHIWRPKRFRALLGSYAERVPPRAVVDPHAFAEVGLRTLEEVEARLAALVDEAAATPLGAEEVGLMDALLAVAHPGGAALVRLRDLAADLPAIVPAVDVFERRLAALEARGVDAASLPFATGHGRSSLEYYDGFVFSFAAPGQPPLALGGRYDALTAVLGAGRAIPAVGGVIRPALTLALGGVGA